jgi:Fe2+ or Zn2+ uptake regulation protein
VEFTGSGDLSDFIERIEKKTGFAIDEHILQLYGLCPQCQEQKK